MYRRDKGDKIYGPPKNRHWKSIKDIPDNNVPSINDPITKYQNSYLNGGSGSDDAQLPPFFGKISHEWLKKHVNYYEEVITIHVPKIDFGFLSIAITDYRSKCPILRKLKKIMRRQNNRKQSKLFRTILPKLADKILSAYRLSRRIAFQKCLKLYRKKYPDTPVPLIYRPRDRCKQNCLVPISGLSEK
ncbi:hypothetical protein Glove_149g84 [Diversispora epigaea]|uniref:Uncharacterized protein n=1 Tax=Diversispora epigaea TaxID=1348612 RepID=A0A397ITL1_9GLOM|nr:hypothetical protein Glove_149g84 [Diversispora epigaea]